MFHFPSQLVETSARENINVEETFRAITELVIKSRKEQKARLENDDGRGHAHDGRRGGYGNDAIRVCIQGVSITTSGIGYYRTLLIFFLSIHFIFNRLAGDQADQSTRTRKSQVVANRKTNE